MKQFSAEITVLDLKRADSYTDRGRYVVCIDGQRWLSGNSEIDALKRTLARFYQYKTEYQNKYYELCKLCHPISKHFNPENDED